MLARLLALIGGEAAGTLAGTLIDKLTEPFRAYLAKQTTVEELRAAVEKATLAAAAETEQAHTRAFASAYAALMQAAGQSATVARAWAAVVYSQLAVLLWHQVGIPAVVWLTGRPYPSSGTTVEWAYLLLAACVGLGALALRGRAR